MPSNPGNDIWGQQAVALAIGSLSAIGYVAVSNEKPTKLLSITSELSGLDFQSHIQYVLYIGMFSDQFTCRSGEDW